MSLVWNRAPLVYSRPDANLTWEGTSSSKFTITKEYVPKAAKGGGIDGQLHLPGNDLTTSIPMHPHHSKCLLPSKSKVATAEVLNQGLFFALGSKLYTIKVFYCSSCVLSYETDLYELVLSKTFHMTSTVRYVLVTTI